MFRQKTMMIIDFNSYYKCKTYQSLIGSQASTYRFRQQQQQQKTSEKIVSSVIGFSFSAI